MWWTPFVFDNFYQPLWWEIALSLWMTLNLLFFLKSSSVIIILIVFDIEVILILIIDWFCCFVLLFVAVVFVVAFFLEGGGCFVFCFVFCLFVCLFVFGGRSWLKEKGKRTKAINSYVVQLLNPTIRKLSMADIDYYLLCFYIHFILNCLINRPCTLW